MLNTHRFEIAKERAAPRDALAAALQVSPLTAQVLLNRGVSTADKARRFLAPELDHLHAPEKLPGAQEAAERISRAIQKGEKAMIHGDYDVDGISATALLLKFFKLVGHPAGFLLPTREGEGYGLHSSAIKKTRDLGYTLLITADCGITAREEADFARKLGIDLVITDHHEPQDPLPKAAAIVHPRLPGTRYPFGDLCGTGVALKLVSILIEALPAKKKLSVDVEAFLLEAMGLAALATLTDVAPLLDENRVLTVFGLKALSRTRHAGIAALKEVSGMPPFPVTPYDVGFKLGPRLNAAGRMGDPTPALDLLMADRPDQARRLAEHLERENRRRQKVMEEMAAEAEAEVAKDRAGLEDRRTLVLAKAGWHVGVIGIVAARMAETYGRPAILISLENGEGRGSGRSVPGFHLLEALEPCGKLLTRYGGHAAAAGLALPAARVADFAAAFELAVRKKTKGPLQPCVAVDTEAPLAALSVPLARELGRLEPFGAGNPEPIFVASQLALAGAPRRMGNTGQHLSFLIKQGSTVLRAVAFGHGGVAEKLARTGRNMTAAYTPRVNAWEGKESVELFLKAIRTDGKV